MQQTLSSTFDEYLKILYKRKKAAIACFIIFFGLMALNTYRQVPIYQTFAKIIIGPEGPQRVPLEELLALPEGSFLPTQIGILRSEPVALGVVRALKLVEKNPQTTEDRWVDFIQRATRIERQGDSRIYMIIVEASFPELARDIANSYGEVYIQQTIERTAEASRRSLLWLTEQVADLKKRLEESELALVQYLDENSGISLNGEKDEDKGDSLNGDSGALKNLYSQLMNYELEIRRLSQKYKDTHPKIIKLRSDIGNVRSLILQEKKRLSGAHKARIQYDILKREVDLNTSLYNLLMKEAKETKLLGEVSSFPISILERAKTPISPIRPQKTKSIITSFLLGIFLALGVAFAQELLDRSIKNEEEIERYLKLPLLGVIPRVKVKIKGARFSILEDPFSHESEAWRLLKANIKFSTPQGELRVLLVTSTGPTEGKTTLAKNLAVTLAQGEDNVLLVDADLRRPMIHKSFEVPQEPGLTNLLVEKGRSLEDVIQPSGVSNLSLLTCGSSSPNPTELLESRRMKEVLELLEKKFNMVVLDSPPVTLVSDAIVLSPLVDSVLLVVEAGRLSRDAILKGRLQLEKARAKICGIALNKAKIEKRSYYYNNYYYRREEKSLS